MVASQLREPRPASPEPYQPNEVRERAHPRPASRPQIATARQPRLSLDSLAIGAPLTAALVGVLLTEGEAGVGGAAAGAADGGSAGRRGDDEASAASRHEGPLVGLDPAAGSGTGEAVASTGGEILDPVAAEGASAIAPAPGAAAEGTLAPSGAPAAGVDGETVVSGGISITLGTGAALDDLGLGGIAEGDGAQSNGRIGATISGTAADNTIHGTPHDDRLFGGAGNDTIYGYEGDDLLDGGAGDDQLFGGPGNDRLLGAAGQDQLFGGTGDDALLGGAGNDRLLGEDGRDWLDGGAGDDVLDGGPGADDLGGGTGNDVLMVDNIHDVAVGGGSGNLGVGGPLGFVAPGSNTLVVQAVFAADLLEQMGQPHATFMFSENFGQTLPLGVAGYTHQVAGDIQNITLEGTADHDVVGDSRANVIRGNDGDNQLYGGGGDDILRGGAGDDLLYGEAGNDNFVIGLNDSGVDTVFDHEGSNWLTIEGGAGHRVQTALAGDQLHVVVDDAVVAVIDDYRGHEGAWAGIDTGAGLRSIDQLMAGQGPALGGTSSAAAASTFAPQDDVLGGYLSQPSLYGTAGNDHLIGTSDADWLVGDAGNDHLIGGAGDDILQGGRGNDLLEGGAGDDRYLFKAGDGGLGTMIRDSEGANVAELDGFTGAKLKGVVVGQNLVVVANYAPLFTLEDFVGNEQAFAGVQMDDQFVSAEDLLT